MQYCFKENFAELNDYIDLGLKDKIYPLEFALENEKLPSWVLTWLETSDKQEKLNYLTLLGVHTETKNIVLLRKFFVTEQGTEIQANILSFPQNSIFLINTLKWLQNTSFSSNQNAKLENLKHLYSKINFAIDTPLLYVKQIEANEITYILEVSNATKYYFENPNKELEKKIFDILQNKAFKLLALEYFKNWQANINPAKIDIKRQLDTVILANNSQEWQDKAYQQWKTTQTQQVFIYNGEKLPYKTTFLEQEIHTDTEGLKIKEGSKIYVCQSQLYDIKNHLKEYISADELIKLYQIDNDGSLLVQTLQSKISQLEEFISNLLSGTNNNSKWVVLDCYQTVKMLIDKTNTSTGLSVVCRIVKKEYPIGEKTDKKDLENYRIQPNLIVPDLSYQIKPKEQLI